MRNRSVFHTILPYLPYLLLIVTFVCNVSWNIADHDDGHTLGFHAMGRQPHIQRSYGAYDSMCDYLLGLLPINYKLLLGCMVGITLLSALSIVYFSGKIIHTLFGYSKQTIALGLIAFMVGMPEFLYMIVSFKSVYISLNFVLIAFYLLLQANQNKQLLIISALVFGLGASFRWNMLMCGLPVFAVGTYRLVINGQSFVRAGMIMSAWGLGAIVSALLFITISGYPPVALVQTYLWGKQYAEETNFQLIARIGDLSLFLTPLSGLLMCMGLYYLLKNKTQRILFALLFFCSLVTIMAIGFAPSFKFLAPLWLALMVLCCAAIVWIEQLPTTRKRTVELVLITAFALNWFIGIQIDTPTSNWGPGLAVKTEIQNPGLFRTQTQTDTRFKLENIHIGFVDGFCLPTSEGMRPLYGHFYALFCGKLKALDAQLNHETDKLVSIATQTPGTVIYTDRINPYLLASYLKAGYSTSDSGLTQQTFIARTFSNGTNSFTELRIRKPKNLDNIPALVNQLQPYKKVLLGFTYTSSLNKLLDIWSADYHYIYQRMGPMAAELFIPDSASTTSTHTQP